MTFNKDEFIKEKKKEMGSKLDLLVKIAIELGSFVNSDKDSPQWKESWKRLNYLYEEFCQWRHKMPYREIAMSDILEQSLNEAITQAVESLRYLDTYDLYSDFDSDGNLEHDIRKVKNGDFIKMSELNKKIDELLKQHG